MRSNNWDGPDVDLSYARVMLCIRHNTILAQTDGNIIGDVMSKKLFVFV